jgi:hypothetical protein
MIYLQRHFNFADIVKTGNPNNMPKQAIKSNFGRILVIITRV